MTKDDIKKLKAYSFAEFKHNGQLRKGDKKPYITHPLEVAYILSNDFNINDETVLNVALLHDTIEDTETVYEEIEKEFGKKIAEYVVLLTKPEDNSEDIEQYWRSLLNAPEQVKIIKIADRVHNLRSSGFSKKFQENYYRKTVNYILPIAKSLGEKYEQILIQTMEKEKIY